MQASKARAGRRVGKACHRRWIAYGKWRGKGRRRGSPRSSTTSASIFSKKVFSELKGDAAPGDEDRGDLRQSVLGQAKGRAYHCEPNGGVGGVRSQTRLRRSA